MELASTTSVVVVGAGPVGLAVGSTLAGAGVPHVVLDRAEAGANTSRAAVVHARTLEVLEGLGVTDELVDRGVVVPHFAIRDRDTTLVRIGFSGLPTAYPYTLMVPQDVTETVLAADLARRGSGVLRAHEVVGCTPEADGRVRVDVEGPDGPRHLTADYVVGADGMHSRVRELAGIPFSGAAYASSFVLADVRLEWPLPRDEVQLFFSPAGLVVVAPLPHGRHRVVATVDDAPEHPDRDDVAALLAARGPRAPVAVGEVVWSSRFRVHHRLADRYRSGSVFLAGDAAHVHSPAGGQGMNIGIQDGVDLGHRLAAVLGSGADPATLDAYEATRRPAARRVVGLTDRITRAATLAGPAARVRNLALRGVGAVPPIRRAMAMNLAELAVAPPAGPAAASPAPSRRA